MQINKYKQSPEELQIHEDIKVMQDQFETSKELNRNPVYEKEKKDFSIILPILFIVGVLAVIIALAIFIYVS